VGEVVLYKVKNSFEGFWQGDGRVRRMTEPILYSARLEHGLSPWNDRPSRWLWKRDSQVFPETPETFGMRGTTHTLNKTYGCSSHPQKRLSILCETMDRRVANTRDRISPALDIADSWT
jgi:hypothetical protein